MRFLLVSGLVCVLMFALAQADEIEADFENDVFDDVFASRDNAPVKRGMPKRKAGPGNCGYGFWCVHKK